MFFLKILITNYYYYVLSLLHFFVLYLILRDCILRIIYIKDLLKDISEVFKKINLLNLKISKYIRKL